ncbi:MAG: helix-turn-helix domain-containing protein [Oscillospiraceae bacterium]|jgi:hypothetical protein|nr:helix-turn-helix domain-containing protein [Oscillospiraceae bacterium]
MGDSFMHRARMADLYPDGLPNVDLSVAVALEAERLASKYGKDTFDCEALISILGVGRNNVRDLMRSNHFPTLAIGGRKVVSAIALAKWMMANDLPPATSC